MVQPSSPSPSRPPATSHEPTASMRPIKPAAFGYEEARHLLWRAGFGGPDGQIEALVAWGPERAVDTLLDFSGKDYPAPTAEQFSRDLIRPATDEQRRMAAQARRQRDEDTLARLQVMRQEREREDRRQARDVQKWWLTRMIESPRPLEEKLTLFWHGHFATSFRTIEDSYHMYAQNQLFRSHAAGNFGELLADIIRDPAMLAYLDNNDSRKGHPNENLAREIMELFSLGVGNYSEADIKEGARALTGYTFYDDGFVFRQRDHDQGMKHVLGAKGSLDGDEFVRAILAQRACPRYIARKFYRFFAADLPDREDDTGRSTRRVLDDLSETLASANYEVKPLLRRLLLSEHFYDPIVMGQQIKSPVQLVVGAIRSLGTPVRELAVLLDAMDLMGQNILLPPSVKGWDGGRSWINTSTLYVRQNILTFLLTGRKTRGFDALAAAERYDPAPLLAEMARKSPGAEKDPAHAAAALLRLTVGRAEPSSVAMLTAGRATADRDALIAMLLLITAMPEYQLC